MRIEQFLGLVSPQNGKKIIAVATKHESGRTFFKYKSFDTVEQAAKAAQQLDNQGETVYFAVNGFGDWYLDEVKNKKRIRTQENVVACRSLYDDFDVGDEDGKYAERKDALADIIRLAKALKLTPTITSSGGGYHAYFSFDEDVDVPVWEELSAMKRDITNHLGMKADRAVDMDSSRILRPVGTHNRKKDTPRPVEVVKEGKAYPVAKIREALTQYIEANDVKAAPGTKKPAVKNAFAAAIESYPDSDPNIVADRCSVIKEFRDTGLPDETVWHRAVGAIKHCEGAEQIIHDWSSKYKNYDKEQTQEKIDAWTYGSTSCQELDRHTGCMADCPHKGKIKFPIQLGYTEKAASVATVTPPPAAPAQKPSIVIEGQNIPYWPASGWRWSGGTLQRGVTDHNTGVVTWRDFCRSFVYPLNRIQDSEGTWVVHWRAKEKNGKWREFFMPTLELASTDQMAKTFAAHEIFLTRNKSARSDMAEFAEGLIETLQAWRIETKTYKQFGWVEDFTGFVMGTVKITAKDEETVLCDSEIPPDICTDFGRSGTLDEWVENINTLYNRPGAEPFQFALCHSMGSALVELMGSSNWHGLPLAFTGHGGTGKSTALKIACGFYGDPSFMERQGGEQGSTLNAAIKRLAMMGTVPVLLDEFSGRHPEELTRTGYALANGRDKERLGSNGKFSTVGGQWFKNSFITSNDSIHESISKLPAGYRVEATQLRFFEVQLPQDYRIRIFSDITQEFIEHHMNNVYGEACRPFIQFIIKNHDWVRRQMVAARAKFNPKSDDDNKERFYRDTIVTAYVAGKIAEKLNLISFDLSGMKNWALDHVVKMRESRKETNTDISEHLAQFISTLPGRLIITKHFGDARVQHKEIPFEQLRGPAIGRVATDDKKVFLAVKAVNDWCKEHGVAPVTMKEELDRAGYLIYTADGQPNHKIYLGAGTTVPSGQSRCYELKYSKVFGGKEPALQLVKTDTGLVAEANVAEKNPG